MKKQLIFLIIIGLLAMGIMAGTALANKAGSLGKISVGTDVSEWEIGSGQINGEFVVSEIQGIELGLRIQERFEGPITVIGDRGNRVGVYEASTGESSANRATWNYDFHVDLSNAKGNARGRTLDEYRLVLEQDYTEQSLFRIPDVFDGLGFDPVELPFPGVCDPSTLTATLCQQSWNPTFGNTDFDLDEERTYKLRLVLTPATFHGPTLAVVVLVNVTD